MLRLTGSSLHGIVKKVKKKIASFAIVLQIAKVMGAVHNKCLINKFSGVS